MTTLLFLLFACDGAGELAPVHTPTLTDPTPTGTTPTGTTPTSTPTDTTSTPTTPTTPTTPLPLVRLNEVMPGNESTLRDDAGGLPDWVELWAGEDVDLTGWSLVDGDTSWVFPAGTSIAAGGHLVVLGDGGVGALVAPLSFSKDGEKLKLVAPDGREADELEWPELLDDAVYGRFPSGTAALLTSIIATPGAANPDDPGLATDPSEGLFPADRVLSVQLEISAANLKKLDKSPYEYVPCAIVFEGWRMEPVGVHIKGQWGSRRSPYEKAAWKVDLDRYVPGMRFRGLEKLTLNNMVQDPSSIHETLGYELLREAGSPAPRTAWAEVSVNGQLRGLYLHIDSVDDAFLERWFDDPDGNLYEGEYGQDLTAGWVDQLELDEAGANDVSDRSDLWALADLLARTPTEAEVPALEALVDVDRTLTAFAGEAILAHWDGYFYSANNWRIYHDPSTGKFTLLVSGIDQTWSGATDLYVGGGDLNTWMLQIPSIRARYELALWDLADRMAAQDVPRKAADYATLIEPYVAADPFGYGVPTFRDYVVYTVDFAAYRPLDIYAALPP